jgi:hypothetical protein
MIFDNVTGKDIPNIGAEANRQAVVKYLLDAKGYSKGDIRRDAPIEITVAGENYRSQVDLVISVNSGQIRAMVIKCAAGSLGSREREALAAARLLEDYQIPYAVVSDGRTAVVLDTVSGKKVAEGMDAIPSKEAVLKRLQDAGPEEFPRERREREKLIFRTYDSQNVNVQRNL